MPAPKTPLIQPFLSDRMDLIGDVHGEIDALRTLLTKLGVDAERGRADRPLVFVGDLIDRGPDSVAVCELVEHLIRSGIAQCILGNHEFNALRKREKQGNGWLIPHQREPRIPDGWHSPSGRVPFLSREATPEERARILAFLATLPVALESSTLRVVHAAWSEDAIQEAKRHASLAPFLEPLPRPLPRVDLTGAPSQAELRDRSRPIIFHPGVAAQQMAEQNGQPAKVLTSGLERPIPPEQEPEFISGKWRLLERSPWWLLDQDPRAVVFGHYWRRRPGSVLDGKAECFAGIDPLQWMGPHRQAFCVDFSVGYRFKARHLKRPLGEQGGLAALRWPEKHLIFDDLDEIFQTH